MFTNILKGDPMAKQKIDKNYLDFIPVKNPEIKYETTTKEILPSSSAGKDSSTKSPRNFSTVQK